MKSNFTLEFSTYTAKFILHTPGEDSKTKLITEKRSVSVFVASKKIEKDLREYTTNEIEKINESALHYYSHNLRPIKLDKVINIDIKNAYASILYNDGFISGETFEYLSKIDKLDRLAALGMLAYKRNIFQYENGELKNTSVNTGEFRDIFFYAVKKTGEIMKKCEAVLGKNYLFTWVDGIYFKNIQSNIIKVAEILENEKLNYSIETLKKFEVEEIGNILFVTFDGNKGYKTFNIPKIPYTMRNKFAEYFNNHQ